jgi:glycosyltransferase involved in cell wall biosynthesis
MISLCMIVLNEAEYLARALANVKSFVHEINIVDGGSSDDTVKIARSFNARLEHHPWKNDFAEQRNLSLELAACKWALVMDADETFEEKLLAGLQSLALKNADAFEFPRKNFIDGVQTGVYPDHQTRFFRRTSRVRYHGAIHEQLRGYGKLVRVSDVHIIHDKTWRRQNEQNARYEAMREQAT